MHTPPTHTADLSSLPDLTARAPGPANDLVTTHDGARDLLAYAIPGARVTIHPVAVPGTAEAAARTRRYEIVIERAGRAPVTVADAYSLPVHAGTLARAARAKADAALRQAS